MVDCGRYPAKATVGQPVAVEADIFADGPDELRAEVRFRHEDEAEWHTAPLEPVDNDRWRGEFPVPRPGCYWFRIVATVDAFASWRRNLMARADSDRRSPSSSSSALNWSAGRRHEPRAPTVGGSPRWPTSSSEPTASSWPPAGSWRS